MPLFSDSEIRIVTDESRSSSTNSTSGHRIEYSPGSTIERIDTKSIVNSLQKTRRKKRWAKMDVTGVEKLNAGQKVAVMNTPSLKTWIVEQLLEDDDIPNSEIAEWFADGGLETVTNGLMEVRAQQVGDRISDHGDPVAAFNAVTEEWPVEARILLAEQETERDRSDYPEYEAEAEQIADSRNVMIGDWQTTLDQYGYESPFRNDDLNEQEAELVLWLAANDEEITLEQLQSIEDYDQFRRIYEQCRNITVAIENHRYDATVGFEVLKEAAPPEDWPDSLNPQTIRQKTCAYCGTSYFEIATGDGIKYATENGQTTGGIDLDEDDDWVVVSELENGIICESCEDEFYSSSTAITHADARNSTYYEFLLGRGIAYDCSDDDDSFSHINELGRGEVSDISEASSNPNVVSGFAIQPNTQIGTPAPQLDAIADIGENPEQIDGHIFTVVSRNMDDRCVVVHNSDAKTAQNVKETLEAAVA